MSQTPSQPPEGYYKPYKIEEHAKAFALGLSLAVVFGAIVSFVVTIVLTLFDNSSYALNHSSHAFSGKFEVTFYIFFFGVMAFTIGSIFVENAQIHAENQNLRRDWEKKAGDEAEKERNRELGRTNYRESYAQYLPIFTEWQRQLTAWQEERAALEKFNPALEDYNRHAQGLAVEFEALWREVELHARLVLEVSDRSTVIEIFKQAFRESLARKPSMGLFRTYVFDPPFQPEQFPEGHIGRSEDFAFWMLLLRSTRSIEYLDGDDRLHAVKMDLPQLRAWR